MDLTFSDEDMFSFLRSRGLFVYPTEVWCAVCEKYVRGNLQTHVDNHRGAKKGVKKSAKKGAKKAVKKGDGIQCVKFAPRGMWEAIEAYLDARKTPTAPTAAPTPVLTPPTLSPPLAPSQLFSPPLAPSLPPPTTLTPQTTLAPLQTPTLSLTPSLAPSLTPQSLTPSLAPPSLTQPLAPQSLTPSLAPPSLTPSLAPPSLAPKTTPAQAVPRGLFSIRGKPLKTLVEAIKKRGISDLNSRCLRCGLSGHMFDMCSVRSYSKGLKACPKCFLPHGLGKRCLLGENVLRAVAGDIWADERPWLASTFRKTFLDVRTYWQWLVERPGDQDELPGETRLCRVYFIIWAFLFRDGDDQ
ncbi:MAG: uncharacterized protein A8A55_2636 [Amphiamblys sp. WSBS2006]|nr:MAG: uncharacterized protein A8A55_2636 [Amphiamblys sp. WSBS2006]